MTSENNLTEVFFRVFGIEPKIDYDYKTIIQNVTKTGYWFDKEYLIKMFNDNQKFKVIQVRKNINYPEITAEKLLRLLCIAMKYKNAYRFVNGIEDLKEQTLEILISLKDMVSIYAELQQLFTE